MDYAILVILLARVSPVVKVWKPDVPWLGLVVAVLVGLLTGYFAFVTEQHVALYALMAAGVGALVLVIIRRDQLLAELKEKAEALNRSEERLRFALSTTRMIAWEWNPRTGESWGTEKIEPWLGLPDHSTEDWRGWLAAVHPEDRERVRKVMESCLYGQQQAEIEHRMIGAGGRVVWVQIRGRQVQDAEGRNTGWLAGTILDVTADREARARLRMLESAVLHAHDAVVVLDAEPERDTGGRAVRFVNDAFCRLTGYSREELVGRSLHRLRGPGSCEKTLDRIRQALDAGTPLETDLLNYRKDGTPFWVELSLVPVPGPDGGAVQWIMVQRDVTERRRIEEHLRQSTKLEAIGQMAGGIAHDFNNLLTAAIGNLGLLKLRPEDPNRSLLKAAELACARAADLTRKLLGYARRNQIMPSPIAPLDVLDEAAALIRRTLDPRIKIVIDVESQCGAVVADATLLNQAVLNLCLNARDAMPEGGTLTLSAGPVWLTPTKLGTHPEGQSGEYVRISVRDTGHGIPDDVKPRLFEPFFTTKPVGHGTGLGLPMVQGIVKQHNGWIECQSDVGKGTCFDVYLPRVEHVTPMPRPVHLALPAAAVPAESGVMPLANRMTPRPEQELESNTVLLVDDDAMIRDLGKVILENAGYPVLTAEDGEDAVDVFAREHSRVGLVILDMTMPRMSGRDAFRELVRIAPNARIMFSTGYCADSITEIEGSLGLLSKPYRPQEMVAAVRQALSRPVTLAG